MSIVLNEYEWAERAIANRSLGAKPTETLSRISRYYYANKYSKPDIRRLLDSFMLQCNSSVSLVKWSDTLDRLAKNSSKYPLICVGSIKITDMEMGAIKNLKGKQLQRLAFTLLCVAKYWDIVSDKNNHWVNSPDKEIMKMANINTSIKRQSAMFGELRDAGLIKFSKKIDNLNVQVCFMLSGQVVLEVHDFRNLGYQYLKYNGEKYFECENCGITVKMQNPNKGRPPKYCPDCAVELHTRQIVDSVMRQRKANKT